MRKGESEALKVNVMSRGERKGRETGKETSCAYIACVSFAHAWAETAELKLAHGGPVPFYLFAGRDFAEEGGTSLLRQT